LALRDGPGVGEGSWLLMPRSIPPMEETLQRFAAVRRTDGVSGADALIRGNADIVIPAKTKASILLDQSRTTNAYPVLETSGGAGSTITLTYAEALIDANGQKGNRNAIEGRTVREILREGPIETARAISIMLQTSAAVAAAHEAGIIHRDLKPSNILVTQSADQPAIVKVLDFGIAKFTIDEDGMDVVQANSVIGTPRYMSPEQYGGLELTPATDVYSLGVILYEMLAGMAPFTGSTPAEIAEKHAHLPPHAPREIVAAIPEDVERIVLHALEKRPEDRPANAAEFRQDLFDTAERLGLEHHAFKSAPDIETLRDAGVESPSGRLVVDLSRLREKKALSSGSNEIKVLGDTKPR